LAKLSVSIIRINELAALLKGVIGAGVLLQQPVVQIDWVAVGSLLIPVIATLFVEDLEEDGTLMV
jgi:hypothetical protein